MSLEDVGIQMQQNDYTPTTELCQFRQHPVAGYHTELIKFLPPLNIGEEDLDYFLFAIREVLDGLQRIPGSAWNTVRTLTGKVRHDATPALTVRRSA